MSNDIKIGSTLQVADTVRWFKNPEGSRLHVTLELELGQGLAVELVPASPGIPAHLKLTGSSGLVTAADDSIEVLVDGIRLRPQYKALLDSASADANADSVALRGASGELSASSFKATGTIAESGTLRCARVSAGVVFRNEMSTADIEAVSCESGDVVRVGDQSTCPIVRLAVATGGTHRLTVGNQSRLIVDGTGIGMNEREPVPPLSISAPDAYFGIDNAQPGNAYAKYNDLKQLRDKVAAMIDYLIERGDFE